MVWASQTVFDGNLTGGQIYQPPRNEEGTDPPWSLFGQEERGVMDAFEAADTGAKENARATLRVTILWICLLYTSPSPRDRQKSRMPSSA